MHVVDVSHANAAIHIKNGCLNVSSNGITLGSVPLADVSAVLLSSPHSMCSVTALASLAGPGTPVGRNERLGERLCLVQSSRTVRDDARTQNGMRPNRSERLVVWGAPRGAGEALQI